MVLESRNISVYNEMLGRMQAQKQETDRTFKKEPNSSQKKLAQTTLALSPLKRTRPSPSKSESKHHAQPAKRSRSNDSKCEPSPSEENKYDSDKAARSPSGTCQASHPRSDTYKTPDPSKDTYQSLEQPSREIHHLSEPSRETRSEIPDSDAETDDDPLFPGPDGAIAGTVTHQTDLEQSLPQIKTDKQAIQEYEAQRAAENASSLSSDLRDQLGKSGWVKGKSSIYVDAFNLALDTVLEEEAHLFDDAEKKVFDDWRNLEYEAQYLYVRLFLRKTAAWHRINRLRYYGDIADLQIATELLFRQRELPDSSRGILCFPGELEPPPESVLGRSFTFADSSNEHISSLEEASSLLLLDELKVLAKGAKVQGKNKGELLKALKQTSGRQTSLEFESLLRRTDTEESTGHDSEVAESREESPTKQISDSNRDSHYVSKILAETGECIRLSAAAFKLFERVHLVFYRSTEWTEKSLTTIILARIARRNFPEYIVSRSANIFASQSLLLEFEAALRTQFKVDSILEFSGTPTKDTLQVIVDMFEAVYPRWEALLAEEQRKEDSIYASGEGAYLRRLSPAWVYTRIVHKGAYVLGLGKFKQHAREHQVLSALLDQRLFHGSRRGAWYQRKALLEEHYMAALTPYEGRTEEQQKKHWKRIALSTCEQGLQDNLTHLIHHYDLQKRVTKLEKALKIAKRLQHEFGHARLVKPFERFVEGVRVERKPSQASGSGLGLAVAAAAAAAPAQDVSGPGFSRRGARTVWLDPASGPTDSSDGPSGDGLAEAECTVEEMCLSNYRARGYKGYHSEGGIARTLFALLFYDVLFAYVPNVFQTAYQTCPLDLHTDAFYATRLSEINARCAELSNGQADAILTAVWTREAPNQTCVVGLDWSYELADLREILRCFPGEQLATLCRVLAQEYAQRGGGMPDLFLWHPESKHVCFAEVKSENDRLSDTQRLWIHVLLGAGIAVELCHAVAKEVRVKD